MRHKLAGKKLSRPIGHRRSLYRNLVTELLRHDKIVTTDAKAKAVRGLAERMITLGKKGGLSNYRRALSVIMDERVTQKVFADMAPKYAARTSGFTRVVKLGPRLGDNAPMVQLELVD